ncbi:AMP-binding protein [Azospirillum picis]|uniref:Acyl-coenzyme A synthetase/AMP-(Fatty) acid ligase n=1 Tax=Azospirillum picis TaxID=488438 RepID=A0ABU0MM67_9PROT|nr:AMP-binding protein [Azospirillum picis]MBP2300599.1 acyl-coenzyme A synthetase/AMP-(fatty) acid ligase [Azospirillum picis]MDQ0534568.1 acyl-coenzyme A synthetase/AMP-(fatty) acid ligase [Azospirillum picis]
MIRQPDPATPPAAGGTQSLERAIALLRAVAAAEPDGARLADLMAAVGLSKATAHRLLMALAREALVDQDMRSKRYHLGSGLVPLGELAQWRRGIDPPSPATSQPPETGSGLPVAGSPFPEPQPPAPAARPSAFLRPEYRGISIPLAHLLCDRHVRAADGARAALLHESVAGQTTELSFARLARDSARFATVLAGLGVRRGDRVAVLLPKGPELLITALAIWRLGGVYMPLFTTYTTAAVAYRLADSEARAIVTNGFLRRKVPRDNTRPVVTVEGDEAFGPDAVPFWSSLHDAAPLAEVARYRECDAFALIYTSESEPTPLGVSLPVKALSGIEQYMRIGLDLRDDDIYWNMADPGWAYGAYYGLVGPLLLGRTTIFCDGPYDVRQGYRMLTKFGVTNLTAAPSQIRAWHGADPGVSHQFALRILSVVGEPLPADLIAWANRTVRVPLLDQYGQRETGIFIVNRYDPDGADSPDAVQPPSGSLGRPMPGFRVVVLDPDGREAPVGGQGEIAIDVDHSPLFWFESYANSPDRTARRFRHGRRYYLTGDRAFLDEDGNIHYRGRASDAIQMQQGE